MQKLIRIDKITLIQWSDKGENIESNKGWMSDLKARAFNLESPKADVKAELFRLS